MRASVKACHQYANVVATAFSILWTKIHVYRETINITVLLKHFMLMKPCLYNLSVCCL